MRLVTFESDGAEQRRVGIVRGDQVVDAGAVGLESSATMLELIRENSLQDLSELRLSEDAPGIALSQVRLCAPIPRPDANVVCIGRNYYEHAVESAAARREEVGLPTFFTKAVTTVSGPYDDIPLDSELSSELDWEVELGVVIGRRAKRVTAAQALDHVFGYTVLNDVSARDLQHNFGGQFFYGKSLDGACPSGPWIVTADEVSDPQNLTLRLRVNGVAKQEASTSAMIYDVRTIIEILSRAMTLEPGQIIATGTPVGVGFARTPPEYLESGDVVESEIEGLGVLRNRVVAI